MSVARKILSNTLSQIIGKVLMAVLGIFVVKIATNYLSVEGYGQYTVVYEFLAFFGIAADLGLFTIAVKEMSEDEEKIPKIIGNILSLRIILITFAMLIGVVSAFLIPKYQGTFIPIGVAIASATVFLTILNGTITSVLQVKMKMHISSFANVLGKIISVLFMAYIVFFGFPEDKETGFYMLIFAGVIGNLIMVLSTNYYVKKITPLRPRFDFDLWKNVLKKALPYGIALILGTIYFRIDSILIYFLRNEKEVGIYAVGMRILEHVSVLPLYFMNSVLPVLTKALKEKSDKYKKVISYSFDFLSALSVPMVVGTVILAYPIIFVVSTPEFLSRLSEGFYGSDIALQVLIFALLFQFLNILFSFILIALDKQVRLLYINAACVLFNIVTNLIFIPHYGFVGAAVTSVFSELFILIATYIAAKRLLKFSLSFKNTLKIIFSSLVMGLIIYLFQPVTYKFLQNWNLIVLVPLGVVIYIVMLFLTRTISKEMLGLLKREPVNPEIGDLQ